MEAKSPLPGVLGGHAPVSSDTITILGDCLNAISKELDANDDAESRSLSSWLQWLDEEGYDARQFAETLQGLCREQLDQEHYTQLEATAFAIAEQPGGMRQAINFLQETHPVLLDLILTIVKDRQQDLSSLNSSTGGLNVKKMGIHLGEVAVFGLFCYGVKTWRQTRRDRENELIDRQSEHVKHEMRLEEGRRAELWSHDVDGLTSLQKTRIMNSLGKGVSPNIGKRVTEITKNDIEDLATAYAEAHFNKYTLDLIFRDETVKMFHGSSNFKTLLKKHAVDTIMSNELLPEKSRFDVMSNGELDHYIDRLIVDHFKADLILLETIGKSDSFNSEYESALQAFQEEYSSGIDNAVMRSLSLAYEKLLFDNVDSASEFIEDNIRDFEFNVPLKQDILNDLSLERVPLQDKIDMFCVGRVRAKAEDFEDYLKKTINTLESDFLGDVKSDLVIKKLELASKVDDAIVPIFENAETKVYTGIRDTENSAKAAVKNTEGDLF